MLSLKTETLYTGTKISHNVHVNIKDAVVDSISKRPKGKLAGEFHTLTPAFVDPHCHIGMFRAGEPSAEADVNDEMDSILPLADALDGVQMDDPAFSDSVSAGVLYSCVLPGSANIIGGMSAVIRNYAYNTTEALITRAGLKAAFGYNTSSPTSQKREGRRASTRMGCLALFRSELAKVAAVKKKSSLTLEQKVLRKILNGEMTLRCHVHKSDDIAAVLRVADEFSLKITIEHACNVTDIRTFNDLARRGIPVIYGPVEGIGPKTELRDMNLRNIRNLLLSGVEFGIMTDHDVNPQSNLFYLTRHFTRHGLSKEQAMEKVTRVNAAMIGIDDVAGTVERGKWASLVCWNGDPFSMLSYPTKVYGEGKLLYESE
ncbi:MAG: amidohydrolase family protein [Kiritimatiellaeota bacterium]|nr:amidohydrolase family protein [Kiritimatiellota bacterium]